MFTTLSKRMGLLLVAALAVVAAVALIAVDDDTNPVDAAAGAAEADDELDPVDDGLAAPAQEAERSNFADIGMARASLAALDENGVAELAATQAAAAGVGGTGLTIVHRVGCETNNCDRVAGWGTEAGFAASAPVVSLGHGGVEELEIELREPLTGGAPAIAAAADRIHRAMSTLTQEVDGTIEYVGWAPELDQEGR